MNRLFVFLLLCLTSLFCSCNSNKSVQQNFKAKQISKSASFIVHTDIETAFPLFGAFEERKWAPQWTPELIYPEKEIIQEGTTFRINGHNHGHGQHAEPSYLWIVTKYNPKDYLIQYLVSTENRFWTITVQCFNTNVINETQVSVTYTYTGLNSYGNALNQKNCTHMFQNNLEDWATAINSYLSTL